MAGANTFGGFSGFGSSGDRVARNQRPTAPPTNSKQGNVVQKRASGGTVNPRYGLGDDDTGWMPGGDSLPFATYTGLTGVQDWPERLPRGGPTSNRSDFDWNATRDWWQPESPNGPTLPANPGPADPVPNSENQGQPEVTVNWRGTGSVPFWNYRGSGGTGYNDGSLQNFGGRHGPSIEVSAGHISGTRSGEQTIGESTAWDAAGNPISGSHDIAAGTSYTPGSGASGSANANLPPGSVLVDRDPNTGAPIYRDPDGNRLTVTSGGGIVHSNWNSDYGTMYGRTAGSIAAGKIMESQQHGGNPNLTLVNDEERIMAQQFGSRNFRSNEAARQRPGTKYPRITSDTINGTWAQRVMERGGGG